MMRNFIKQPRPLGAQSAPYGNPREVVGCAPRTLLLAISVILAAPTQVLAQGCAMCQTALTNPNDPVTRGFNWSIGLLICAPYTVVAVAGGWLAYKYWRARAERPTPRVFRLDPIRKEGVQ